MSLELLLLQLSTCLSSGLQFSTVMMTGKLFVIKATLGPDRWRV